MKTFRLNIIKISILTVLFLLIFSIKTNAITIILDPGHGGNDAGAVNTQKNIKEAEVNYKIAKYLYDDLKDYENVKVYLTRTQSEGKTLQQRADVAFKYNADLLLSIHIDSSDSGNPAGASAYVTHRTDLAKYNKNCTALGNVFLSNLNKLGIKNRGVLTRVCHDNVPKWMYADGEHADYYGIIRYCMKGTAGDGKDVEKDIAKGEGIPVVLLEHCYINGDSSYIDSDAKIKKVATSDLNSLVSYYNLKKSSTSTNNNTNTTTAKTSTTPKVTVAKPTINSVSNVSTKSAKVTWKKDASVNGYEIYMATAKTDSKNMKTKEVLHLRKAAKTTAKSLKKIPKGAKVQIIKKNVKKDKKYTWYKVKYNGKTGYVASKYLETIYLQGTYSKIKTINSNKTTTYTKNKLTKNKKYTFKIRSYKKVSGKTYYSSYSSAKWVTIKK